MKTIITIAVIIIIVTVVLFVLPFLVMLLSYICGVEMGEDGSLRECIGCPEYDRRYCEKCKENKRAEKIRARQEKRYKRQQEKKHRRKERLH